MLSNEMGSCFTYCVYAGRVEAGLPGRGVDSFRKKSLDVVSSHKITQVKLN